MAGLPAGRGSRGAPALMERERRPLLAQAAGMSLPQDAFLPEAGAVGRAEAEQLGQDFISVAA